MLGEAVFFAAAGPDGYSPQGWSRAFAAPAWHGLAYAVTEVMPLLERACREQERGRWLVLALAYEAAPAFDPVLAVHAPAPGDPVAFAAAYDAPLSRPPRPVFAPLVAATFSPALARADYHRAIAAIRAELGRGEAYQVNYTFPLAGPAPDNLDAWFCALAVRQQAGLCCRLDLGGRVVLSFSPELFFTRQGQRLTVRPMKGTAPRAADPEADAAAARALAACPKNQAENRMIVDLMRNDLGRIAVPGSVAVPELFAVEPLGAAWQMTTTVTAEVAPATGLTDILRALFPCGSITGAPKAAAMRLICEHETGPRGFYTGALGFVAPDGDCAFNVAIRTVVVDAARRTAVYGVGGGITHDSRASDEHAECRLKARFLSDPAAGFSLLETLRLDAGRLSFLPEHLERLDASAAALGFAYDGAAVAAALDAAARQPGRARLRLTLSPAGQVAVTRHPLPARLGRPARLGLCPEPVDPADPTLFHKTTRRARYDAALAGQPDRDDVVLCNTLGEVTESCRANLVVRLDGRLFTPAADCGLLPGTYRARLLARGVVAEARLTPADLKRAEAVWLVNALRLWTRAAPDF
jgi:para-aminobenzoate synthetase/4-amino-4-deoxychorismate lyase